MSVGEQARAAHSSDWVDHVARVGLVAYAVVGGDAQVARGHVDAVEAGQCVAHRRVAAVADVLDQ